MLKKGGRYSKELRYFLQEPPKAWRSRSTLVSSPILTAGAQNATAVDDALGWSGQLAGEKAVNIAAHAHAIDFGLLAILLAFFQPYVSLRDSWKRNWAWVLLCGSLVLPVFVLLELKLGLLAGGIADVGGLLVILALLAMWIGIVRYTGEIDAVAPSAKRRSG